MSGIRKQILIGVLFLKCISAFAQVPSISSFSPVSAPAGTTVTITGSNFNATAANNVVYFGSVKAAINGGSTTSLTVTVPANALMDKVTVIDIQSQLSGQSSTVFRPVFSPNKNWFFARDLDPKVEVTANNSPNANSVGPFTANNVVMGDLDGDGKNDVLTTSQNHVVGSSSGFAEYVVLRNNYTSGVLTPTSLVPAYIFSSPNTSFQHTGTKLADLNGDGKLDIIVGHNNTNNFPFVSIYFNTSSGPGNFSFGARQTIPLSVSQAVGIDIADMNSDGKLDIIMNFDDVNNSGPAKVTVLFNQTATGSSTFSFIASDNISMGAGIRNKAVVVRDFDGDGKPDIATSLGYVNFTASAVARNTTAPGSTTLTLATGAALTQSSVGAGPGKSYNSMDAADFDGDGKQDLVMSVPGGIDLFRNTSTPGTISFAARVTIPIAGLSNPTVSTGDMNGDGRPDIVITDDGTSKVSVIANQTTGTGSFTAANFGSPVDFSTKIGATSTTPSDVMVGDITGDGKPDIIVGNATVNTITLFRNVSDGANWPPVITSVSALNPQLGNTITITGNYFNTTPANNIVYFGAVKGTVTGGSTTSLTVTFPSGALYGPVSVTNLVNNLTAYGTQLVNPTFAGKSTFSSGDLAAKVDFSSSGRVTSVAYGDFDGDGKPDLVVANKTSNQVTVYKNISTQGTINTSSFSSVGAFATGNNPLGIRIADIDGDGKLDILTGDSLTASTGAVSILRNTSAGVGNFSFASKLDINTSVGSIFDVAIQDMNGDGLPDLIVPLWGNIGNAASVALFANTGSAGNPSFGPEQSFTTGTGPAYVEIGDFNGDGNPDIVVANFFQSSGTTVSLLRNTTGTASATFSFAAKQDLTTSAGPLVPFIADINLDGKPDIVTANFGTATTTVSVLQNTTAAAATTFSFNAKVDLTVGTSPRSIAVRDMNGDGMPDIVTSNYVGQNVSILINQMTTGATITAGGFAAKLDVATGGRTMDIALEDVDGDGLPDITTANGTDNTFSILRNQLLVAPSTQATNIIVTNITGSTATLNWTNGNGEKRAVFMKAVTTGSPAPVDLTAYAPNAQFGSGAQISATGWFNVFTGTTNTVNVTGLTSGTTYRVKVIEYNDNGQINMATYQSADATGNPVNFTAIATVTALSRTGAALTNATSVLYNFSTNTPITGLGSANFSITTNGTLSGTSITAVNGSGSNYSVTISTGSGDGTLTLTLNNSTGVSPALSNTLPFVGDSYTIDKTAPVLNPVTIASNNTNPAAAKTGDIITVSFTGNETLQTPTVLIAGHATALTNTGGNNWKATYTMQVSDAAGAIPFSISFADLAGNPGTNVTAVTSGTGVTYYPTASVAILSAVTISSNNFITTLAKTGDVVSLNITASGTIATLSVSISGHTAAVTNTGGNNWTASYTMTSSDAEGTIAFAIDYTDPAGNAGARVTATTNGSSVFFDHTAPTASPVTISSNNANSSVAKTGDVVTLLFTTNENIQVPSVTVAGNGASVTNTGGNNWKAVYTVQPADAAGNIPFNIAFADIAGNAGTAITSVTSGGNVSNFPGSGVPALGTITIASNNSNNTKAKVGDVVTISITAAGTIKNVSATIVGHTASVTNTSGNNWTATYTMTGGDAEGAITFAIDYTDPAGNAGTRATATTNGSSVVFDRTAPTLNPVTISSSNSNPSVSKPGEIITLTFTASETLLVPTVSIAGQTASVTSTDGIHWTATYTVQPGDASGTIPFNINYADLSGNAGTAVNIVTGGGNITNYPATGVPTLNSVTIASNNSNTARAKTGDVVTVNITAAGAIKNVSAAVSGHTASVTNTIGNNWTVTYTMTGTDAEGIVPFTIDYTDPAGNAGTTISSTTNGSSVIFDRTVPMLTPVSISSNNTNTTLAKPGDIVTITITADGTLRSLSVTIAGHTVAATNTGGNNWTAAYTMSISDAEGVIAYNIIATDLSGNTTTVATTTNGSAVTFNRTLPVLNPVSIVSNNLNPALARAGDIVSLTFTSSKTITTPTVVIEGHTLTPVATGNNWSVSYTMVNGDPEGNVSYSISSYADVNGNAGATVTGSTDGTGVFYSNTPPNLSPVTFVSNNANPLFARSGNTATLQFTASEAILLPTISIAGHTVSATSTDQLQWTAAYTFIGSDAEGIVPFSISYTNLASNPGNPNPVTTTTNGSHITFDITAPTLNPVTIVSSNANPVVAKTGDIISLSFTANENIQQPSVTILGHTVTADNFSGDKKTWSVNYTIISSDAGGTIPFSIGYTDLAGNAGNTVNTTSNGSSITNYPPGFVPTLNPVSIVSNNANTTFAKTGDLVSVSFTANAPILTPSITIAGNAAAVTNTGGNNWLGTYTMTNSGAEGNISFAVDYSDAGGNAGTTVTATSNGTHVTFDHTAPLLNPVIISSNNANTGTAKTGDIVTLNFTADESIQTPAVTIAGNTAAITNTGGNNWKATYTMQAGDAAGNIPFNISFADLAGNAGTPVSTLTSGTGVVYYPSGSAAGVTAATITSNNANTTLAKTGDIITLNITANGTLASVSVSIAGHTAAVTNTGGNNWTATYTMGGSDAESIVPFAIDYSDPAANTGAQVTATTNGSSVRFDRTAPTLNPVTIVSNNANNATAKTGDVVTVSFTANESIQTPAVTVAGNTAAVTNTGGNNWQATYTMQAGDASGNIPFSIGFADLAGNTGTNFTTVTAGGGVNFYPTASAATLSSVTIASNNINSATLAKTGNTVTLAVVASGTLGTLSVTMAGHTAAVTNTGGNSWKATYTFTGSETEGVIAFAVDYADPAGNAGTQVIATTNGSSVLFDRTAPTLSSVTLTSNNANISAAKTGDIVTLNFTASEAIGTPVVSIAGHSVASTNTGGNNWQANYTMLDADNAGTITFAVTYADLAGNAGAAQSTVTSGTGVTFYPSAYAATLSAVTIASDNTNPTLAKTGNLVTLSMSSTGTLVGLTVTVAGHTVTLSNTGGNNWNAGYTMTGADVEGVVSFTVDYADPAGNSTAQATATTDNSSVTFDRTVPTLSPVSIESDNADPAVSKPGNILSLSFTASESLQTPTVSISGQPAVVTGNGIHWTAVYTVQPTDATGTVPFTISYTDLAGNGGTPVTMVTAGGNVTNYSGSAVPTLGSITIASNNANSSKAKTGDAVTVSITATGTIKNLSVTIAGHTAAVTNTSGNNWTATYIMTGADAEGLVPFAIDYTDVAGNAASTKTATTDATSVNFDRTAPTLNPVTFSSNNADPSQSKPGDVITLSFTASEPLQTPTVTIAGQTIAVTSTDGIHWTATYTVQPGDADGTIPFNINYADLAGNAGTAATSVTTGGDINNHSGNAVPTLGSIIIVSSNANAAKAKIGDAVTLSITASGVIKNLSVTISGHAAAVTNTGGNDWTAAYTMTGADAEGIVPFAIDYTDAAGNVATTKTATTDATSVTFDRTAPTLNPVTISSNNMDPSQSKPGDVITLSFTASEPLQTPTVTIAGQTAAVTSTDGIHWTVTYTVQPTDADGTVPFSIVYADLSGNAGTAVATVTTGGNITNHSGNSVPALGSVTILSSNANASKAKIGDVVSLHITAAGTIKSVSVSIAGHAAAVTNTSGNNWTAAYTMTGTDAEGIVPFAIDYTDVAGNAATTKTTTTDATSITFDRTAPTLNPVTIHSNNADPLQSKPGDVITLSFTASEPLQTPTVTVGGQTASITSTDGIHWTATYTVQSGDADGTIPFSIAYADLAGNTGTAITSVTTGGNITNHSGNSIPALGSITIASNNADQAKAKIVDIVTINVTVAGTIKSVSVTIAGHTTSVSNTSGNNWTATYTMTGSDAEGIVPFTIDYTDAAGNTATTKTATTDATNITFDRTVPTLSPVTISSNNADPSQSKPGDVITLSFTASEPLKTPTVTIAGQATTLTSTDGIHWTATYTVQPGDADGTIPLNISYADLAGNAGAAATSVTTGGTVTNQSGNSVPALGSITIASNNANTSKAKTGDVITLSITAAGTIKSVAVTIAGHTASVTNTNGNNWKAVYTVTGTDAEGIVPFTIDYTDVSGNAATTKTATTNNSSVTFDRSAPTLNPVMVSSSNADPSLSKPGDVINLSFTASEPLKTPTVTIAGQTATLTSTDGIHWTATYTVQPTDTDGTIAFSINYADLAGNAGTAVTTVTTNGNITNQSGNNIPALGTITIASGNANASKAKAGDVVTLNIAAAGTIKNVLVTIAGHTASVTNTGGNNWEAVYTMTGTDAEGIVPFTIGYTDAAGNPAATKTATTNASSVIFDRTAPTLGPVTIHSANGDTTLFKPGTVITVSFTASEPLQTPTVTIAGQSVAVTSTDGIHWTATYTIQPTDAGSTIGLSIVYTDLAGNTGRTAVGIVIGSSVSRHKDVIPGLNTISIASNNTNVTKAKVGDVVTLSITAAGTIKNLSVTIAGHPVAAINSGGNDWKAMYTMIGDDNEGVVLLTIDYTDTAGNAAVQHSGTTDNSSVQFIKSLPVLSAIHIESNNTDKAIAYAGNTVSLSFAPIMQDTKVKAIIAGHTVPVVQTATNWSVSWKMTSADTAGIIHFSLTATDAAGNVSATIYATSDSSMVIFYQAATANNTPVFTKGSSVILTACKNAGLNISSAMTAYDKDAGQPISWTVLSAPLQGSLSGFERIVTASGDTLAPTGFAYTPVKDYTGADSFKVQVSDGLAMDTITVLVNVRALPLNTLIAINGTSLCGTADPIRLKAPTGAAGYTWYKEGIVIGTGIDSLVAMKPGNYTVRVKDNNGCLSDTTSRIVITMGMSFTFCQRLPTVNVFKGEPKQLEARTIGTAYQWMPATNLENATIPDPNVTLDKDQEYKILMTTKSGCVLIDTIQVRVYAEHMFLANVFSPNSDGKNDKFYPVLVGVKELKYFRIYNRTGKKIFETSQPNTGWDGTYNGDKLPLDSYVWQCSVVTDDGEVLYKQGMVTLLK